MKASALPRIAGALLGAYLPLIVGLVWVGPLLAGSPFFAISILGCLLGFHLPMMQP